MGDNTHVEILIAGAFAAFTVDLLVYPLDTIKTRLQSQDYIKTFARSGSTKQAPTIFRGLYQGVGSVIIATLPAAGVFFTTYESAKAAISGALPASTPKPAIHSLASGLAELASCLVLTPAEVIKQNAQMIRGSSGGAGSRSTSVEAFRMIWQSEGGPARRLWSGYTALAARNLPFTALQFPMFEFFRGRIWEWRDRRRLEQGTSPRGPREDAESFQERVQGRVVADRGPWSAMAETGLVTGASAGLSGSIAAVVTTPFDVVKTRMMLMAGGNSTDGTAGPQGKPAGEASVASKHQRQTGLRVVRQVYQERGVKGLFRGGAFRAGWTALGSGLYLGTYEVAKIWLKGGERGIDDGDL